MNNQSDLEVVLKTFLQSKKNGNSSDQFQKISDSLNTPQGRMLLKQISTTGGDALKNAAGKAAQGNVEPMKSLIANLMSTKEGLSLMRQIIDLTRG